MKRIAASRERRNTPLGIGIGEEVRVTPGCEFAAGGISCELASGRHTNLFSDPDTERSIAAFTAGGNAFHQSLNLYWLAQKSGTPAKDTHVLLRGEPNEFSVSQRCGAATYEHILNDVLRY